MLQEPELSVGLMGHVAHKQTMNAIYSDLPALFIKNINYRNYVFGTLEYKSKNFLW